MIEVDMPACLNLLKGFGSSSIFMLDNGLSLILYWGASLKASKDEFAGNAVTGNLSRKNIFKINTSEEVILDCRRLYQLSFIFIEAIRN
jgi:hypothetical protein